MNPSPTHTAPSHDARPSSEPANPLLTPFRDFARSEASGAVVLLAAALVALVWANSPWADSYVELWGSELTIGFGELTISESLQRWINDGLMAAFFLLVGLEIKRELLVGELASLRRATLPIVAAVGGAVLPAVIFLAIVGGGGPGRGWGIPMATDIAFALAILALVGRGAPLGLRVFLTALAIADDLIAIGVIAVFYTSDIDVVALAAASGIVLALLSANRLGIRRPIVYGVLGVMLWIATYASGVHATVAGVLLALTIPARARPGEPLDASEQAQSPMLRIEHALQAWVAFLIVPLFALANAGVAISGDPLRALGEPVTLGVLVGLVVGKQVGITVAAFAIVRLGLASLPRDVGWRHIYGAAWLGGIGFTMSLFVASLAYGAGPLLASAKIGILSASLVAGLGGMLVLRRRS